MNAAVRHTSIFRITASGNGSECPAFPPDERASCFEEAYRTFTYDDEVALFSDLVEFNRMSFLFEGMDVPGYDPVSTDPNAEDIVRKGTVLDDGSIMYADGRQLPAEAIWGAYGMDVPTFSGFGYR